MNSWDPETEPEPSGWIRNINTGRRRVDGDPAKEYLDGDYEREWELKGFK